MRNGVLAVAVSLVAFCGVLAGPAGAATRPLVGIGDQKSQMFEDPRFGWLGIKHARLVVPWYVGSGTNPEELRYVDEWLRAARRSGVQPLIGFGHGFVGWTRIYLPKVAEYRRAVKQFRRRYPWVKNYITWNEANHCSQPTCRKPARVAQYYDALRRECKGCTVVGAALIDQPNMTRWLRAFRKEAKGEPKVYGLHNYLDVNRLRTSGTRRLLRAVPRRARIWITETGGLVYRKHYKRKADFPENAVHAGKVTSHVLRTARALRRIDRVYLYHWNVDRFQPTWDSGLIDHLGVARPGFDALARHQRRDPRAAPAAAPPPPRPAPPIGTNPGPPPSGGGSSSPPPSSEPPPPSGGGGGGSEPPPPGDECSLANLCIDPLDPLS
jgi:hypothetical protein